MEKTVQYLTDGTFDHRDLSEVEKLELLEVFRFMMLDDAFDRLERDFIRAYQN